MENNLRATWMVANQGTRLVNIQTACYFEQMKDGRTYLLSNFGSGAHIADIDQPLSNIIRSMEEQGLVFKFQ